MAARSIPEGFVEAAAVRDRLGVHGDTWSTLLRDSGTVVYAHPSDRRRRLLRELDAAKLLQSQPIKPRRCRRDAKAA